MEFDEWLDSVIQEAEQDVFGESQARPEDIIEQYEAAQIAYYGMNMAGQHVTPSAEHLEMII